MDANGLRFWLLTGTQPWSSEETPARVISAQNHVGSLRLTSRRSPTPLPPASDALATQARSLLEQVPQTRDPYGTWAFWDEATRTVKATGVLPDAIDILIPAQTGIVSDLAIGYDGVLYLAIEGQLLLSDRRNRWAPMTLVSESFKIWRMAADPSGGLWVLDRMNRQLGRVLGLPLATDAIPVLSGANPNVQEPFCACDPNPHPPRIRSIATALIPLDETPIAITCSSQGQLALLLWKGTQTLLRLLTDRETWSAPIVLNQAAYPYSVAWTAIDRIALLQPSLSKESIVYELPANPVTEIDPVGDFYGLRQFSGAPFCHTVGEPAYYLAAIPTPLIPLHLPAYATQGTVKFVRPIDSHQATTHWHRLYLEAKVPEGCGIQIWLATTATPETAPEIWFEHRVGDRTAFDHVTSSIDNSHPIPVAAWLPTASEIPFHSGLLDCPSQPQRSGLFTVLIQRSDRVVRSLQGRYLWVKLRMLGNGHATPDFAALRAYGSRFSYQQQYLPELYQESVFAPDADLIGASTPADFLDRFLSNFEGILTPLEDRIAYSDLLTDPRTTPEEVLDWLGSWIGVTFDPAYPIDRRRQLLQLAPQLFRQRGTLAGLTLALDVATGGSVSDGEIIILEDFRLRRTFATILGADLADEDDPLLAGLSISGNAYVGDTLVLGDETQREFLALFSADLKVSNAEKNTIDQFFESLTHRVTLFIHNDIETQNLGLIRRIVEQESPAHVITTLAFASYPLLVGLASLVGIDTYLRPERGKTSVRVNQSAIGLNDVIQRPASLDPRLEGDRSPPSRPRPVANISPMPIAEVGQPFVLNAENSTVEADRSIVRYIWTRLT
jgi:phage tail-like protein